jgi:hypothetical protein
MRRQAALLMLPLLSVIWMNADAEPCSIQTSTNVAGAPVNRPSIGNATAVQATSLDALTNRLMVRIPPVAGSIIRTPVNHIDPTSLMLALDMAVFVPETAPAPLQTSRDIAIDGRWWVRHELVRESTLASPDAGGTCDGLPTPDWFSLTSHCKFLWCDAVRRATWSLPDAWTALRSLLSIVSPDDAMFAKMVFSPGACVMAVCDGNMATFPTRILNANFTYPRMGQAVTLWLELRIALRPGTWASTHIRVWEWPVGDNQLGLDGPTLWRFASTPVTARWMEAGNRCPAHSPMFPSLPAIGLSLQGTCQPWIVDPPPATQPNDPQAIVPDAPSSDGDANEGQAPSLPGPDAMTAGAIVAGMVGLAAILGIVAFCQYRLRQKEQDGGITDTAEDGPILISEDERRSSSSKLTCCKFKKRTCKTFCCCCFGSKPRSQRKNGSCCCCCCCCGPTKRAMPMPISEQPLTVIELPNINDSDPIELVNRRSKKNGRNKRPNGDGHSPSSSPDATGSEDDVIDVSAVGGDT